jgi:cytoskeleton protein RodZ
MSQAAAQSHASQQGWENFTDMPVGEILRRTRLHYGQSLTDVESILRIRAIQLAALEEGRIDQLPGRVYAIGFVRAYAEYLGLDGEKMVHLFKMQSGAAAHKARPELQFPVPASESKIPHPYILGGSFAGLVLVVIAAVMLMGGGKDKDASIPDVPANLRAEALQAQPPAQLALADPLTMGPQVPGTPAATLPGMKVEPSAQAGMDAAAMAANGMLVAQPPGKPELVIRVLDTAWVEVRNPEGRALLTRVLKPGDSYTVPEGGVGMVLDTGNIGGLEFVLNGQALPPLGAKGDVRRKVSLDPEKLIPSQAAAERAAAVNPAAGSASGHE